MDIATVIGLVSTFALIAGGILLGSSLVIFWDTPSILIVLGGTIGAIMVNYPMKEVISILGVAQKTIFQKAMSAQDVIKQFIDFSTKARREGILSLEGDVASVTDEFIKKGVSFAIDGLEPDAIRDIMETETSRMQDRHKLGAEIFILMGTYSPAMGMIGTLIGLVQMLQSMDDPSSIGPAMAVALITTFYGAILANVIFLPFAGKLKTYSSKETIIKEIIVEGVISLSNGENPRIVEQKLMAFLPPKDRVTYTT